MIQIDRETMNKLARKRELSLALDALGERNEWDETLQAEHNALQAELVSEFLPLVSKLAEAGLLSVSIGSMDSKEQDEFLRKGWQNVGGNAERAFENGNIVLHADRIDNAFPFQDRGTLDRLGF